MSTGRAIRQMIAAACAICGAFAAASSAQAFNDAALAKQTYEKVILPGYARFDAAASTLVEKADALCRAPSHEALAATRGAARVAILAWGRVEPIRFGPVTQNQRTERLLFYPDSHALVGKQTAKVLAAHNDAEIDAEKLVGTSVAVQGFGALDFALFGPGSDALASSAPEASFRCRYVHALALGIARIASETNAEWKGEYGKVWLQPGGENKTYLSAKETTQALYRAYVTQLEVLRTQRLAMLGGTSGKPAGPLLPNSRLTLPFILAGIEGARDLIGDTGFTAEDLATNDKESDAVAMIGSVATDLGFAVRAGEAAVAMSPDPLNDPKARERLTPMQLSLKNAETLGNSTLGTLTGQSLGFNSLDGD